MPICIYLHEPSNPVISSGFGVKIIFSSKGSLGGVYFFYVQGCLNLGFKYWQGFFGLSQHLGPKKDSQVQVTIIATPPIISSYC